MINFHIISIFPEMFAALTEQGVVGRFISNSPNRFTIWNPRDFAEDSRRTVDDRPYGGGPGMVMMAKPLLGAINAAKKASGIYENETKVIYLAPTGDVFNHKAAESMAIEMQSGVDYIFLCGRYEGVDQRLIDDEVDETWSIGDFVLSGGEIPAMVMIDAVSRLIPGCLGNKDSFFEDSFVEGLLDYGHYTRPENFEGKQVPDVLLSGDHNRIKTWRQKQALKATLEHRPELIDDAGLSTELKGLLKEIKDELS